MTTHTATEQGRRTADLPPQLFRHWIHSREEDRGDVRFFRPDGFDFPPSRGVTVVEIGGLFGGVAGFHHLFLKIRGSSD